MIWLVICYLCTVLLSFYFLLLTFTFYALLYYSRGSIGRFACVEFNPGVTG